MVPSSTAPERVKAFARSLDDAVEEVFRLMMGIGCLPVDEFPVDEREMISAIIGLAGAMSGICVLCTAETVALRMAEAMTSMKVERLNDTVKDAVGEVCNMVAGAWKARLALLASQCMLSTPTVITGTNYQLHYQRPAFRIERHYRFERFSFTVIILCESMQ